MNEAIVALMTVLGEYDVLWDGTLFSEILDAEVYDCPGERFSVKLPGLMCFRVQEIAEFDRIDALVTSITVVSALAERCGNELPILWVDGILYDCPDTV